MTQHNQENTSLHELETFFTKNNLVDEAFGQGIITVNEYRQLLGLPTFPEGDVTVNKKTLAEQWKN